MDLDNIALGLEDRYRVARCNAVDETGPPESTFPSDCPYSLERILDDAFWPGEGG